MKRHIVMTSGLLSMLLLPRVGVGAEPDLSHATIRARSVDSASDRGATAGVDPWASPSALQLFSRPSLDEGVKIAMETGEEDTLVAVAFSPDAIFFTDSVILRGLQVTAAYGITSTTATFGAKFSLSLRDTTFFDSEDWAQIDSAGESEYVRCVSATRPLTATSSVDADAIHRIIERCEEAKALIEDEIIDEMRNGRWAFSAGASASRDFGEGRWGKLALNVSADVRLLRLADLILNADLESGPSGSGNRGIQVGGSAAVSIPIDVWKNHPIEVAAASRILACVTGTCTGESEIRFGPRVSVALTKDSILATSMSWLGNGPRAGDALLSLALSHSFGLVAPR